MDIRKVNLTPFVPSPSKERGRRDFEGAKPLQSLPLIKADVF
jgi:hypothetical protein